MVACIVTFYDDDFYGRNTTAAADLTWVNLDLSWFGALEDVGSLISVDFADSGSGVITVTTKLDSIRDGLREGCMRRADLSTITDALGITEASVATGVNELIVRLTAQSLPNDNALFTIGIVDDAAQASCNGGTVGYIASSGIKNAFVGVTTDANSGPSGTVGACYQICQLSVMTDALDYTSTMVSMVISDESKDIRTTKGSSMGGAPALQVALFAGSNTSGGTTGAHQVKIELAYRARPGG